ncbi:MAG: aminotransferase class V-fold PLP-dependent enzyme [Cytophagales bacterium]|nr:aminotransferase class V-fold PLP-dependent enzyme [Cytophagales bacterium]
MTTRRAAIKSMGLTALALPTFGFDAKSQTNAMPASNDPAYWNKIRDQFMLSRDSVFFNPGTVGAMPRMVVDRMTQHLNYIGEHVADWAYVDDNKEEFISGYNNLMSIRTKVANLIHASAPEIAMTDNVTNGMSYIANGLSLQPGDEMLTTNQEHSGGQSGFLLKAKRYGAVFKKQLLFPSLLKPLKKRTILL